MRTRISVKLDDDAYKLASIYARARGIPLGAAISELIRRAEQAPEPEAISPRLKMTERGYYVIAGRGFPATSELVKEFSEDEIV